MSELHENDHPKGPQQEDDSSKFLQGLGDYSDLDSASGGSGGAGGEAGSGGAGRLGASLLGFAAATVILVLLLLDPFSWHGLDESLRGEAAHGKTELGEAAADELWTCPMHPEILQDEPGSCPICGMDLVLSTAAEAPSPTATGSTEQTLYSCGMHPDILEEEPGSCPICGMDLTPLAADAGASMPGDSMAEHAGHDHSAGEASETAYVCPMHPEIVETEPGSCPICGMDLVASEVGAGNSEPETGPAVHIDPLVVQRMNVQVATVERRDILRNIRTVGYLDYDQQRMVTVTPKYAGWVEAVHVNYVGEPVKKGQPLFEIYAPELVRTQQELLSAVRYAEQLGTTPGGVPADAQERAADLVRAARERLGWWDMPAESVDRMVEGGEVFRRLTVHAPASGVVMERLPGLEGKAVKPGDELFHIADLSSLWLSVEVFEDQLAWISPGSEVTMQLSYFPGETFHGRVRFIEPELSETTRTLSLRLEVPNPDGRLRAGMYATVVFAPPAASDTVAVPQQAVLRTGERDLVVVALGDGTFAPRQVQLGHEGDGYVQILQGLESGERIVTSAQFLIDSESNLRAAIQKLLAERRQRAGEKS